MSFSMAREALCKSEEDQCISESLIVQELGRSHKRPYKAHPFDFNTDIFLSTLQKDPNTGGKAEGTCPPKQYYLSSFQSDCS